MKRVGNLWPRLISFYSLARAAERARRGKRFRADVQQFEFDLERNLWQLHEELTSKSASDVQAKLIDIRIQNARL